MRVRGQRVRGHILGVLCHEALRSTPLLSRIAYLNTENKDLAGLGETLRNRGFWKT